MVIKERYRDTQDAISDYISLALLLDYQRAVLDYGDCSLYDFISSGWNVIIKNNFRELIPGDRVFDCKGKEYEVLEEPWESDDGTHYTCSVKEILPDGTLSFSEDYFDNGDLYFKSVFHDWVLWKKKKIKGGNDKLCPILITKTNQHQN